MYLLKSLFWSAVAMSVVLGLGLVAAPAAAAAEPAHIHELPHLPPHEPWDLRLLWIAIGGGVLFLVAKVLTRCWDSVTEWVINKPNYDLADRWKSADNQAILDIPPGDLTSMRLMCRGDDLDLVVTSSGGGWPVEGKLSCHKGKYQTGVFSLKKQPGRLNDLLLTVTFEDGRTEGHKLARS